MKIVFLLPVYNDEASLLKLIGDIKKKINENFQLQFVVINDCSNHKLLDIQKLQNITLINLKTNLGNQKSVFAGILYIYSAKINFDYLVIMDSDGEDDPDYIITLINSAKENNNKKIIFASRLKRNEGLLYIILYFMYKFIFKLFTGRKLNFGNYSCIPKNILEPVVNVPFLDRHYASAVLGSGLPHACVPCNKGKRYYGKSSMSFVNFILHAAKSFSVFYEKIIARFLIFSFLGMIFSIVSIIFVVIHRYTASFILIGWSSNIVLGLLTIGIFFLFIFFSCLLQLLNKNNFIQSYTNKFNDLNFIHSIEEKN